MSLVIDLIGQLNWHVIDCKTRKSQTVRRVKVDYAFRSVYCSGQSFVSQIVCLSVLVSLMSLLYGAVSY